MRVLGVDCGVEATGYGVIESDGGRHQMLTAGVVGTDPKAPLEQRLRVIADGLRGVIKEYSPESAAVEEVFHAVNARTALRLAHARGAVLLVLAEAGLPVEEYSPLEVKTSVVGYGRAEKHQVQMMVRSLLNLRETIQSKDASDALAVAICHATHWLLSGRAEVCL